MPFDTSQLVVSVIIPLIGTLTMVGLYIVTRTKKTEDTTLLNDAEIRNIIQDVNQQSKHQEEVNKETKEDIKCIRRELNSINTMLGLHDYIIKEMQQDLQRMKYRDATERGGNKGAI